MCCNKGKTFFPKNIPFGQIMFTFPKNGKVKLRQAWNSLFRNISTVNYSERWREQKSRSPTQPILMNKRKVWAGKKPKRKPFSFISDRIHHQAILRHCITMIFNSLSSSKAQLQHSFVISTRLFHRHCTRIQKLCCNVSITMRATLSVTKTQNVLEFRSHLRFIARRDMREVKEKIYLCS